MLAASMETYQVVPVSGSPVLVRQGRGDLALLGL